MQERISIIFIQLVIVHYPYFTARPCCANRVQCMCILDRQNSVTSKDHEWQCKQHSSCTVGRCKVNRMDGICLYGTAMRQQDLCIALLLLHKWCYKQKCMVPIWAHFNAQLAYICQLYLYICRYGTEIYKVMQYSCIYITVE